MQRLFVVAIGAVVLALSALFSARGDLFGDISYRAPPPRSAERPIEAAAPPTILFGGDMMFDRSIRIAMEKNGNDFVFSCIDNMLRGADLVVANLEGPITSNKSKSIGTTPGGEFNYTFTFPISTAALLFAHNMHVVSIGNNHILNFGWDGVAETIGVLRSAGVDYFGDPETAAVAHETIHGIRFAFINYNEFAPSRHTSIRENVGVSSTTEQIRAAREAGAFPIVYTHWGIEYATSSSAQARELAHLFVDAGAELVIGSHPHVIQEHEQYLGKHIYYSLGNFIFDQYWNEDVRRGLLLAVTFDRAGVKSIREIPIHLERDRSTCPLED